ncbi:MAG: 16S rRNA (cytosine(967)-C(5))-methyltransferase RsmB [Lachnospiraceae bacterium]
MNSREIILEMLLEIFGNKEYSHIVVKNVLDKYNYLDNREKAFIKKCVDGTVERTIQIDYVIEQFSSVKVQKMKPAIRAIMRMAVYQILFLDHVPDSAACNEAVKLTQKKKYTALKGFVNGVLRNIVRKKEELQYPDREKDPIKYMSIMYSMPQFLVEKWQKEFGVEKTVSILEGFLEERSITIRMKESIVGEELKKRLLAFEEHGVEWTVHPYLLYAYQLKHAFNIKEVPGFLEGDFTVQDVSSMLVGEIAKVKEEDQILDVCAAPGGKSLHVAEKLKGTGHVISRDVSDYKIRFIEESMERMKLTNLETQVFDARVLDESCINQYDIVLLDVPCSGLGVIGKKSDIKYHATPESLMEITRLQKEIIDTVVQYVKNNGTLVYSTCTIVEEENCEMIQYICEKYGFIVEDIKESLPEELQKEDTTYGLTLLPGIHKADGFFMSRLRKIK